MRRGGVWDPISGPALMAHGSFGAVRLAAARPEDRGGCKETGEMRRLHTKANKTHIVKR